MEGIVTFKFKGKIIFKANVWEISDLLIFHRWPLTQLIPDQIFIDDTEMPKPKNMEDDT